MGQIRLVAGPTKSSDVQKDLLKIERTLSLPADARVFVNIMSRAIEAVALFTVGVIAGGAVVYGARKSVPPPPPPAQQPAKVPAVRQDVRFGEPMAEGRFFLNSVDSRV